MKTQSKTWRWAALVVLGVTVAAPYLWVASNHDWHLLREADSAWVRSAYRIMTLVTAACIAVMLRLLHRVAFSFGYVGLCAICLVFGIARAYGDLLSGWLFYLAFCATASVSYLVYGKKAGIHSEWYLGWWGLAFGLTMLVLSESREVWLMASLVALVIASLVQLNFARTTRRLTVATELKETTS